MRNSVRFSVQISFSMTFIAQKSKIEINRCYFTEPYVFTNQHVSIVNHLAAQIFSVTVHIIDALMESKRNKIPIVEITVTILLGFIIRLNRMRHFYCLNCPIGSIKCGIIIPNCQFFMLDIQGFCAGIDARIKREQPFQSPRFFRGRNLTSLIHFA